jgi:ABC transporter substrate binding protein
MRRREFIMLVGGAAAWPLPAHPQQPERTRRIGALMGFAESDPEGPILIAAFLDGLRKLGWTQGSNLQFDIRWAALDAESVQRFAKELVALQHDLILSHVTPTTVALLQQTRTIPIIFVWVSDPVGSGFVATLARPGGNAIGFTNTGGKPADSLKPSEGYQTAPREINAQAPAPHYAAGPPSGRPTTTKTKKTAGGARQPAGKLVPLETSAPHQSERGAQHYRPTSDSPTPANQGPRKQNGPQREGSVAEKRNFSCVCSRRRGRGTTANQSRSNTRPCRLPPDPFGESGNVPKFAPVPPARPRQMPSRLQTRSTVVACQMPPPGVAILRAFKMRAASRADLPSNAANIGASALGSGSPGGRELEKSTARCRRKNCRCGHSWSSISNWSV